MNAIEDTIASWMEATEEEAVKLGAPRRVRYDEIAHAMEWEDDSERYFDPGSGEVVWVNPEEEQERDPAWVPIARLSSDEAWQDRSDFTGSIEDPATRRLLEVALSGPGAFGRFRLALEDDPPLRTRWFAFHDHLMQERVKEWVDDLALKVELVER